MAGPKLDGAGTAKMKTLDEAMLLLQRIHGLVENYALAIKRGQPPATYLMNIRRTLPTLAELLKGQFGMISDQAMSMNLAVSRGSSEQVRVRMLREGRCAEPGDRHRDRAREGEARGEGSGKTPDAAD